MEGENGVPDFCLSFAEVAARLAYAGGKKDVEKLLQIVFRSDFNANELQRHVRGVEDCARLVAAGEDDTLSKRGFTKEILPSGNGCGTSGVAFYKKNVCSVLREQVSVCRPEMFFATRTKFRLAWRIRLRQSGGGWWKKRCGSE